MILSRLIDPSVGGRTKLEVSRTMAGSKLVVAGL